MSLQNTDSVNLDSEYKSLKERHDYYTDDILFYMLKYMKGREVAIFSAKLPVRHIKAHNILYLKSNFKAFHFFDRLFNTYISLASYDGLPSFSYNPTKRKLQQDEYVKSISKMMLNRGDSFTLSENFLDKHKVSITNYDLGLDFDERCLYDERKNQSLYCSLSRCSIKPNMCDSCTFRQSNFQRMYDEVKRVKVIFDEYNIPYFLKSSGSGFHINIEGKHLPDMQVLDKVLFCNKFAKELKAILNLTALDTSVYSLDRVWQVPFNFNVKCGNVALPLTDRQFNSFSNSILKSNYIIAVMKRNPNLLCTMPRDGTQSGLIDFCVDYIIGG